MAYTKLRDMIELATELQASSVGLTIEQIMERTERSRKTVERMLSGLSTLGLKPETMKIEADHHLTKRWRIEDGIPPVILELEPIERSALERHLESLKDSSEKRALSKLLAQQEPLSKHLAINTEMLIERTAHFGKVGPRNQVDKTLMSVLERALQGFEELKLLYRAQGKSKANWRIVKPLGMLFGRFSYLVASTGNRNPATYRLDLIEKVEGTGKTFVEKENWNFKKWASESFGIFHGDGVLDVTLRFKKAVAKRAEKITFHPLQTIRSGRDGSLVVKLHCCGHWELLHELCHPDWLGNVVIEEPEELREEYREYLSRLQTALAA